jgi:hypothetical protein
MLAPFCSLRGKVLASQRRRLPKRDFGIWRGRDYFLEHFYCLTCDLNFRKPQRLRFAR